MFDFYFLKLFLITVFENTKKRFFFIFVLLIYENKKLFSKTLIKQAFNFFFVFCNVFSKTKNKT